MTAPTTPPLNEAVARAYERAARVADYAVERAERDWSDPAKQEAVKQVGAEIAEVIRYYATEPLATLAKPGDRDEG
jgi:hypothetical protein